MFRPLLLLVFLILASPLPAQQAALKIESNDKFVAAGIALKTGYIFHVISSKGSLKPDEFSKAMLTVSKDAESFSKSKIGNRLRKSTERMRKAVTLLMTEELPSDNREFLALLKKNEINPRSPDPTKLALLATAQLREYISEVQLTDDIFRFPEQFHNLSNETSD